MAKQQAGLVDLLAGLTQTLKVNNAASNSGYSDHGQGGLKFNFGSSVASAAAGNVAPELQLDLQQRMFNDNMAVRNRVLQGSGLLEPGALQALLGGSNADHLMQGVNQFNTDMTDSINSGVNGQLQQQRSFLADRGIMNNDTLASLSTGANRERKLLMGDLSDTTNKATAQALEAKADVQTAGQQSIMALLSSLLGSI